MPRPAESTWNMLNVAFQHYQNFIQTKSYRCDLSLFDLLHVSNFKGGNASITEPEPSLSNKLKNYEKVLFSIETFFCGKKLFSLTKDELEYLKNMCVSFLSLTESKATEIKGFGPSYASALLASHFPDLIPILDRRILNGLEIPVEYNSQKQVKKIAQYYPELIEKFYFELQKNHGSTIRDLDKQYFVKTI